MARQKLNPGEQARGLRKCRRSKKTPRRLKPLIRRYLRHLEIDLRRGTAEMSAARLADRKLVVKIRRARNGTCEILASCELVLNRIESLVIRLAGVGFLIYHLLRIAQRH